MATSDGFEGADWYAPERLNHHPLAAFEIHAGFLRQTLGQANLGFRLDPARCHTHDAQSLG